MRIIIFILFFASFSSTAYAEDKKENDTLSAKPWDNWEDDYSVELIAIGGLGMAYQKVGTWNQLFNNCPAGVLGLEIPFSKSHIFALELTAHTWIAELDTLQYKNITMIKRYIYVNNEIYSQAGYSAAIKLYFLNIFNVVRISTHLGWLFHSGKKARNYRSLEFGFGIHYNLSEDISIALENKWHLQAFYQTTPDLVFLNIYYKIR